MNTISINYTLIWEFIDYKEYKFTKEGICFNIKTGKNIKQVYNNGCIGYNIRGKFVSLAQIRKKLINIQKEQCPF